MTADPCAREYETLLLDRIGTDGRVARITLNRPDAMNALSIDLLRELDDALHRLEADHRTRVIVLRGAGRTFSAGYDLTPPRDRGSDAISAEHRSSDEEGRRLVMGVRTALAWRDGPYGDYTMRSRTGKPAERS